MCLILQSITIEDEREIEISPWTPLLEECCTTMAQFNQDPTILPAHISARIDHIRSRAMNTALMNNLWNFYENKKTLTTQLLDFNFFKIVTLCIVCVFSLCH